MNTVTSPPRKRRFAALAGLKSLALGCGLLLFAGLEAASPPTVYQAYTTGGAPIQAGMVADSATGKLYFATLGKTGENPKVVCLNANHTVAWTYDLGANGKVRCVPRLSADGTKLYVGTDDARLICLTSAGSLVFSYPVPGSGDRKVRNTPALGSGQVYFHCNDGKLYALNATSGALVSGWPVTTGNTGGPPVYGDHTDTWSSSPVVAPGGQVYVGSANGRVYGFTSAGSKILDVSIGYPMESNLALGSNGWLYGGTREHVSYAQNGQGGVVFAVNPAAYTIGLYTSCA